MVVHATAPGTTSAAKISGLLGPPSQHGGSADSDAALGDAFRSKTDPNDSEDDDPEWLRVAAENIEKELDSDDDARLPSPLVPEKVVHATQLPSAPVPAPMPSPVSAASLQSDSRKKSVDSVEIIIAADTTGSMQSPILYGKKIMEAVLSYLAGIVDSNHFQVLDVVIHLVGMNDWRGVGETHPVRLFLNEEESKRKRHPVGYAFKLDPQQHEEFQSNLAIVSAAIVDMANAVGKGGSTGGDAREEYGTGMHLIKTIIERSREENKDKTTKYFVLGITDDMQHGMGTTNVSGRGDSWPNGVTEDDIFKRGGVEAHKYACPYAPDTHNGCFAVWKPHSFYTNLRAVLDLGAMVVWAAIGNSAEPNARSAYDNWLGTMAATFNFSTGVLLSWQNNDLNKPVPSTVVHLLNAFLTSADDTVSAEVDVVRKQELAASKAQSLMEAARAHSIRTNGPLQSMSTTIDAAAEALGNLAVNAILSREQQQVLLGRRTPSTCDQPTFRSLSASLSAAGASGDSGATDHHMATAHHLLSKQNTPPSKKHPSRHASPPGAPMADRRPVIRPLGAAPVPSGKAACGSFRSLKAAVSAGDAAHFRSLGSEYDDDAPPPPRFPSLGSAYDGDAPPSPRFPSLGSAYDDDAPPPPRFRSLGAGGVDDSDAPAAMDADVPTGVVEKAMTEPPPSAAKRLLSLATGVPCMA